MKRKNKRNYKGNKYLKLKNYSFDNPRDRRKIDKEIYQRYLKCEKKGIENIDYRYLENVFTNEIHYKAMKELPLKEKQVLYVVVVEASDLEKACDEMKMSKTEIIEIKTQAINRFKENVKKFQRQAAKKKGGAFNE